jgi:hypothetical protein
MATESETVEQWLDAAKIPQSKRTPQRMAVLEASFAFLRKSGKDYASRRVVAHFLLNCDLDLKLAQVARLVDVTRPTASRQNKLSTREVVRQIQHQMAGRPYGKLLPRYAGPMAQFLVTHPEASRQDVLEFVETTWDIRVGRTALYEFLKKYGLDRDSLQGAAKPELSHPVCSEQTLLPLLEHPPVSGSPLAQVPRDFFLPIPSTPVPSCCFRKCFAGGTLLSSASPTNTAPSSVAF